MLIENHAEKSAVEKSQKYIQIKISNAFILINVKYIVKRLFSNHR